MEKRHKRVFQGEQHIAPRPRRGEVLPLAEKGHVLTRFYGDVVQVPAPAIGEPMVGGSEYTVSQFGVLRTLDENRTRRLLQQNRAEEQRKLNEVREAINDIRSIV